MRSDSDDRDDDDSATDDAGSLRTEKEDEHGDVGDDEDAGDGDCADDDDNDVSDDTCSTTFDDNGDVEDADSDRDDEDGTADGSRTIMVDTNVNGNNGNVVLADAIPTSPVSADDRDIVDDIGTTNVE